MLCRFVLKLGPFEIDSPFLLAPMAAITNSPYRRLMKEMGSGLVVSELVSANGLEYASQRTKEMMYFHPEESPVGLQIFSERPPLLVKACQYIQELGADFVDLNLGCPVNKIVKKGAGSAMCRDPIGLGKILKSMVESVEIPVTIKIRTGWNALEVNALEIARVAEDVGVAWVAIHGRTRAQAYTGLADWDLIGDIKAKVSIPVIGNGDVVTPELAVERLQTFGVDAVMIGRGALRNPFIFQQSLSLLKKGDYYRPTLEDYLSLLDKQKRYLLLNPNKTTALLQSKKFLVWYSAGFPHSKEFRQQVFQLKDIDEVWRLGKEFFVSRVDQRNMDFLNEAFLMGGHG